MYKKHYSEFLHENQYWNKFTKERHIPRFAERIQMNLCGVSFDVIFRLNCRDLWDVLTSQDQIKFHF